jgi:hypothetical protein
MNSSELIAVIALIISSANLLLYYNFSRKSNVPAIAHYLKNPPPYTSSNNSTEIKVKNVGTSQARINCIYLKFSWDKDLQLFLHDEQTEEEEKCKLFLAPNEKVTFTKNLPEPPMGKKEHIMITTEYNNNMEKEDTIELKPRIKGNISFLPI